MNSNEIRFGRIFLNIKKFLARYDLYLVFFSQMKQLCAAGDFEVADTDDVDIVVFNETPWCRLFTSLLSMALASAS